MTLRNALVVTAIVGLGAGLPVLLSARSAQPQGQHGPDVMVVNTEDNPVPTDPSGFTHMGRRASEHVALHYFGSGFKRINPDLSLEDSEFTIPSEKVFVLTDVFWRGTTQANQRLILMLGTSTGPFERVPVIISSAIADGSGRAAGSDHVTAGVVLSRLPNVEALNFIEVGVVIEGYLAPSR